MAVNTSNKHTQWYIRLQEIKKMEPYFYGKDALIYDPLLKWRCNINVYFVIDFFFVPGVKHNKRLWLCDSAYLALITEHFIKM